jgi:uncharacterized protein YndB with AHSA1/START domain
MEKQNTLANDTRSNQILVTRIISAPRELVFDAFTTPEHVAKWWGPNGFTTTISEMNVKPGGIWQLVMQGPDGRKYPNKIEFIEVVKPERIVFKHLPEFETDKVNHHTNITFEDLGNKTYVVMTLTFESPEERNRVSKEYGAIEGGHQTLGRLEEFISSIKNN